MTLTQYYIVLAIYLAAAFVRSIQIYYREHDGGFARLTTNTHFWVSMLWPFALLWFFVEVVFENIPEAFTGFQKWVASEIYRMAHGGWRNRQ